MLMLMLNLAEIKARASNPRRRKCISTAFSASPHLNHALSMTFFRSSQATGSLRNQASQTSQTCHRPPPPSIVNQGSTVTYCSSSHSSFICSPSGALCHLKTKPAFCSTQSCIPFSSPYCEHASKPLTLDLPMRPSYTVHVSEKSLR